MFIDLAKTNPGGSPTPVDGGDTCAGFLATRRRRTEPAFVCHIQAVASFRSSSVNHDCVFLVSGKRSNKQKKLPCKFQRQVKLKANSLYHPPFFFLILTDAFWGDLQDRFVMMQANCSAPSLSAFENAQRKVKLSKLKSCPGKWRLSSPAVWFGVSPNTEARSLYALCTSRFLELTM